MSEAAFSRGEYTARKETCDERFKRDKERLKELEENTKDIQKLTIEISQLVKRHDEQLTDQGKRIAALEQRPGRRLEGALSAAVAAAVAAVVGLVMNRLGV